MSHIARWMDSFRNRRNSAKSRRRFRNRAPRCERLEDRTLLATVSGVIYEDASQDGLWDAGEVGLAGWRVFADLNHDGVVDDGEPNAITDADGSYSLDLDPGTYDITAELREPGWQPTLPDPAVAIVTLNSGDAATADFGHVLTDVGPVGGEIIIDGVVNDGGGLFYRDTHIASDDAGNFAVVFRGVNGEVFARLYDSTGNATSGDILVNESTEEGNLIPSIAMAGDGRFVVTWASSAGSAQVTAKARIFAADGTPLTAQFNAYPNANHESQPAGVGIDDSGNVAILTLASKDISSWPPPKYYVQRFDSSGNAVGPKITVAERAGINVGEDLAMDENGNFVVSWWDQGVYTQRFDAGGNALGDPLFIADGDAKRASAAIANGRVAIGYDDNFDIGVRVYDFATGNQLVDLVGVAPARLNDGAPIGIDGDGNVVVTYGGVLAQRFDSSGMSLGEFRVNTTLDGVGAAAVAMRADGGFIIAWPRGGDMYAQVYADSLPTPPAPPAPTFSIDDVSVNEADGTATFTVTRSVETSGAVSVDFATVDGSATAGSDYTAQSGTLTFADGQTTRQIIVAITDDSDDEGDETFTVMLSNPTNGAVIADATGEGTIVDNDAPASATDIYVSNIEFDSRTRGKGGSKHDERILVTIRSDSNGDGMAGATDAVVAGASVTVLVTGYYTGYSIILSGTTDANGVFTSDWLLELPNDTYTATVIDVSYLDYIWNNDLDDDPETHTIPHGALAASTSAVDWAFADEELLEDLTAL